LVHGDGRVLVIESARGHHDRLLIRFEGILDRDGAVGLRGPLYVSEEEMRELDEGEFWQRDLIGCEIVDTAGNRIGIIDEVIDGPAQDLLRVVTDSGTGFIPLVDAIVKNIDVVAKQVVVDPPPGLLD
jgi:16S rRNA processing protein RimM